LGIEPDHDLGDRTSREAFVQASYAELFHWFCRLTGSPDRSAELTQETFASFWGALDRLPPGTRPEAWLYATGRNLQGFAGSGPQGTGDADPRGCGRGQVTGKGRRCGHHGPQDGRASDKSCSHRSTLSLADGLAFPRRTASAPRTAVSRNRRQRERGARRHGNSPVRGDGDPRLTRKGKDLATCLDSPLDRSFSGGCGNTLPQLTAQIPGVNL
jgi:Sigma-70 region 2